MKADYATPPQPPAPGQTEKRWVHAREREREREISNHICIKIYTPSSLRLSRAVRAQLSCLRNVCGLGIVAETLSSSVQCN